jgi:glutaredoxin-like protein NrdH|tara:strand:+ start:176 stop:415 length:240 start_codon:yes stop_codon:yes gene_type:complete
MAETVIVYSTPFCAPCERLKRYLKSLEVEFRVVDLMMDEEAADLMASKKLYGAPVLQVGEQFLAGQNLVPENINAALGI